MTISYNLNIPNVANAPSVDQPDMQENTNNVFSYLAVDHVDFNVDKSGYHKVIHQLNNGSDPAAINLPPTGQIYTKSVLENSVTDTQLFYETGLGSIFQLTGGSAIINGYQHLGSILIQWGVGTTAASSGGHSVTITNFNINFPTACFNVQVTMIPVASAETGTNSVSVVNPPSNSQFVLVNNGNVNSTHYPNFFWMAIGN